MGQYATLAIVTANETQKKKTINFYDCFSLALRLRSQSLRVALAKIYQVTYQFSKPQPTIKNYHETAQLKPSGKNL